MEFHPDVIVMALDLPRVELLVEVHLTTTADELTRIEAQLKRYMRARNCAAGLLVTGGETRIYEDRYPLSQLYASAGLRVHGDFLPFASN